MIQLCDICFFILCLIFVNLVELSKQKYNDIQIYSKHHMKPDRKSENNQFVVYMHTQQHSSNIFRPAVFDTRDKALDQFSP